jgi:MscS family membrane protein
VRARRRRAAVVLACLSVCLWVLAGGVAVWGQVAQGSGAARATPRAALYGYLTACRAGDYETAAQYLDLGRVAPAEGAQLARRLKRVLDQTLWVDLERLSADPKGDASDASAERDRVGTVQTPRGPVPIWVERSGADGQWRIAAATVVQIDALDAEFGLGPLGELLPEVMLVRVGELELWQWAGLATLIFVAYGLAALVVGLAPRAARRIVPRREPGFGEGVLREATGPLAALAMLAFFMLGTLVLRLPVPVSRFIGDAAQVLTIAGFSWLAMRAVDVTARGLELRLARLADTTALTVVPVGRRLAKLFLLVLAVLAALQNLGINVISIVAGLGVIGIGVALAAQKTFENFFGTLSILMDQPVRRGEFCRFGEQLGTVEDIGLRSTRIRTLDRTLITIPNAEFSNLRLENFGARDQIRLQLMIGLRYETTPNQMRHVLIGLQRMLATHKRVTADPARVRLVGLGAHSLDVEIYAHVDTKDWNEFLVVREELLLRVIEVVDASGTGFAFPSQTLYLGRDAGLDPERQKAAEVEFSRWSAQSEACGVSFSAGLSATVGGAALGNGWSRGHRRGERH